MVMRLCPTGQSNLELREAALHCRATRNGHPAGDLVSALLDSAVLGFFLWAQIPRQPWGSGGSLPAKNHGLVVMLSSYGPDQAQCIQLRSAYPGHPRSPVSLPWWRSSKAISNVDLFFLQGANGAGV